MATPMLDPAHPFVRMLSEVVRRDPRFDRDAYLFVFDALNFAQEKLGYGQPVPREELSFDSSEHDEPEDFDLAADEAAEAERHVTGQELCEAMRQYALDQYGMLARCVFDHWGVRSTGDFGEIVFNLIDIGQMRKTEHDRREDFEDVFSFDALVDKRVFTIAKPSEDD